MSAMDVMIMAMSINLNNIVILNICGSDYCCIINWIDKFTAKCWFYQKRGLLKK